jgi:multidrug efflux pump subunit AcrB
MWDNPGATNVRNSWGNRVATWMPRYSQIKGQRIGVARSDVAQWMRFATQGYPMAQMRQGDEVIPIVLKDDDVGGFNLSNLQSIPLFSASGKVYSLEQATADFEFDYQFGAVKKVNRRRVMKAQCDPVPGVNTFKLYEELMQRASQEVEIPQGYALEIFGEQESVDESNDALLSQIPLALILIFIILLLLFGNYRDPIAILLMTPLIFIGVVLGLAVLGKNFDFFALLGMIGLVGMNIKNAVILIASIAEMRRKGVEASEAVVMAASERLLPVCLASFTTILALIPLLFDSLFGGMAAAIMGGLLVATILTVLVLPVVYSLLYNIKVKKS